MVGVLRQMAEFSERRLKEKYVVQLEPGTHIQLNSGKLYQRMTLQVRSFVLYIP